MEAPLNATDVGAVPVPYRLSVIVPFFNEPGLTHLRERLVGLCDELAGSPEIEVIVVEGVRQGTRPVPDIRDAHTGEIRHVEYAFEGELFSIGVARNIGAGYATGTLIAFCDVDLRLSRNGWHRLLEYAQVAGVGLFKKRYFCVPCLYLTERATAEFNAAVPDAPAMEYILRWLHADTDMVELLAPCTSFIVTDRLHFLSHGGYSNQFTGHGFEDFELHHRLVQEMNCFVRPADYYRDYVDWSFPQYKGFRALFSLIGRGALFANVVAVHLWHERPEQLAFYQAKPKNRERLAQAMRAVDTTGVRPPPLVAYEARSKRFLFFGDRNSPSTGTLRDVFPLIGNPVYVGERELLDEAGAFDAKVFERRLATGGIDRVLFPNPYRTPARRGVYRWCRENNFPYVVFERGALANSWFFDPRGFNADSPSYAREHWDRSLTDAEERRIKDYIGRYIAGQETLEPQGSRIGVNTLARSLDVIGRKVLFVPLQRPSDTVTIHMAGPAGSIAGFLSFIDRCARRLHEDGWTVLCKRHPFERSAPPLRWARYVEADTHIVDLMELADSVALMNSSVGLYAMMMGKPCQILADAFYSFDGINATVLSLDVEHMCARIRAMMTVDEVAMRRFLHYLRYEFYSIGHASYETWQEADGAMRKRATAIDFTEIRLPSVPPRVYRLDDAGPVSASAPLYERFGASGSFGNSCR